MTVLETCEGKATAAGSMLPPLPASLQRLVAHCYQYVKRLSRTVPGERRGAGFPAPVRTAGQVLAARGRPDGPYGLMRRHGLVVVVDVVDVMRSMMDVMRMMVSVMRVVVRMVLRRGLRRGDRRGHQHEGCDDGGEGADQLFERHLILQMFFARRFYSRNCEHIHAEIPADRPTGHNLGDCCGIATGIAPIGARGCAETGRDAGRGHRARALCYGV